MKAWLRKWLGITAVERMVVDIAASNDTLIRQLREDLDATGDALVITNEHARQTDLQLLQAAQQLNRNTATMMRWATGSATLSALEAKYRTSLRKAQEQAILERDAAKAIEQHHETLKDLPPGVAQPTPAEPVPTP